MPLSVSCKAVYAFVFNFFASLHPSDEQLFGFHFVEVGLCLLTLVLYRRIGIEANEELRSIFKRQVHLILQVSHKK